MCDRMYDERKNQRHKITHYINSNLTMIDMKKKRNSKFESTKKIEKKKPNADPTE